MAYHRAVDALLAAAGTGLPNACDIHFGLRVTEILAAAEGTLAPASCLAGHDHMAKLVVEGMSGRP